MGGPFKFCEGWLAVTNGRLALVQSTSDGEDLLPERSSRVSLKGRPVHLFCRGRDGRELSCDRETGSDCLVQLSPVAPNLRRRVVERMKRLRDTWSQLVGPEAIVSQRDLSGPEWRSGTSTGRVAVACSVIRVIIIVNNIYVFNNNIYVNNL
jgi:hypothetical protein